MRRTKLTLKLKRMNTNTVYYIEAKSGFFVVSKKTKFECSQSENENALQSKLKYLEYQENGKKIIQKYLLDYDSILMFQNNSINSTYNKIKR